MCANEKFRKFCQEYLKRSSRFNLRSIPQILNLEFCCFNIHKNLFLFDLNISQVFYKAYDYEHFCPVMYSSIKQKMGIRNFNSDTQNRFTLSNYSTLNDSDGFAFAAFHA